MHVKFGCFSAERSGFVRAVTRKRHNAKAQWTRLSIDMYRFAWGEINYC